MTTPNIINFRGYISEWTHILLVESFGHMRHENANTKQPCEYEKENFTKSPGGKEFLAELASVVGIDDVSDFDCVVFSCASGADKHVDKLDPDKFYPHTYMIPVITPAGTVLHTEDDAVYILEKEIYEFNHEQPHWLDVKDVDHGCLVIMVAQRR